MEHRFFIETIKTLFFISSLFLFASCATRSPQSTHKAQYSKEVPLPTMSEVAYGKKREHVLDFWQAESQMPTPVVLVIHGGGWTSGSKEYIDRYVNVQKLLNNQISVVACNYRLLGKLSWKVSPPIQAPMADVALAFKFLIEKADSWNLDKQRIAVTGGSAGGCSALWLAFHDHLADEVETRSSESNLSKVSAVAVINAQTSLDPRQLVVWIPNISYGHHAFGVSKFPLFLKHRERYLSLIKQYSPYELLNRGDPPIYMFYNNEPVIGEKRPDPTHSANFGVKLKEKADRLGVPCELVYPNAPSVIHQNVTDYLIKQLFSDRMQ